MVLMPMIYPWFDDQPGKPDESATKKASSRPSLIARMRAKFRKNSPTPGA
jgi:heavy metal efflux system protein